MKNFRPARDIAYLADVARLENAWVEAYHAAEAPVLTLGDLAEIAPERLETICFVFHPAARLLRFEHPAASIWAAHQGSEAPRAPQSWRPEQALVVRPEADVEVRVLPPGGCAFAEALQAGATLGEATATLAADGFDFTPHLIGLVEAGALTATR